MPLDSAGIAHATGRDNQRAMFNFRKGSRLNMVVNEMDARPAMLTPDPPHRFYRVVVGNIEMLESDLCCGSRHR